MFKKLLMVLRHPGLVRMALGNTVRLEEGDDIVKAVGGLKDEAFGRPDDVVGMCWKVQ